MLSVKSWENKDLLGGPEMMAVNVVGCVLPSVSVLLGGSDSTEKPCCACFERWTERRAWPFIFCFILATRSGTTIRGGGKSASLSVSKSSEQKGLWQVKSQRLGLKLKVFVDACSSSLPALSHGVPSSEGLPPLSSSRIPPIFVLLVSCLPKVVPLSMAPIGICEDCASRVCRGKRFLYTSMPANAASSDDASKSMAALPLASTCPTTTVVTFDFGMTARLLSEEEVLLP
jgi:hypothetical protein